jgi:hypothetical protein
MIWTNLALSIYLIVAPIDPLDQPPHFDLEKFYHVT